MAVKLGNGNWAVKENKLLAYNDNSGRFFNKEFDFARGSSATYVGKDGLIKSAASDVPRIDFSDSTNGALLLEGQSTNLIPYSEDFSNSYWTKRGASVTSGFSSPSGDLSAFKLVEDTSTGEHRFYGYTSIVTGTKHTYSIRVKPNGRDWIKVSTNASNFVYFNISTGVVGSSSSATGIIKSLNNGWVECSITFTTTISPEALFFNCASSDGSAIYTGDGTSGVYIYGAMIEQNSFATSYIPSLSGSATTRLADVCNNSGSAQDFNSEEGVLYAEIAALTEQGSYRVISLSDGTLNQRISIFYDVTDNKIYGQCVNAVTQAFIPFVPTSISDMNKIAFKWSLNSFALYVNGVEVGTDNLGTIPVGLDNLSFDSGDGGAPFFGKTKNIQVFTEAKSDEFLAALTTI